MTEKISIDVQFGRRKLTPLYSMFFDDEKDRVVLTIIVAPGKDGPTGEVDFTKKTATVALSRHAYRCLATHLHRSRSSRITIFHERGRVVGFEFQQNKKSSQSGVRADINTELLKATS